MKLTVLRPKETVVPDHIVREAIAYLDSATDYREFRPRAQWPQAPSGHGRRNRANDVDEFLLVFVPFLLVAVAIIAVFSK